MPCGAMQHVDAVRQDPEVHSLRKAETQRRCCSQTGVIVAETIPDLGGSAWQIQRGRWRRRFGEKGNYPLSEAIQKQNEERTKLNTAITQLEEIDSSANPIKELEDQLAKLPKPALTKGSVRGVGHQTAACGRVKDGVR